MVATTIGWLGLRPSRSRPARIAPAPSTPMIAPHTAGPPRYSRDIAWPSSRNGAQVIRLRNAHCTVTTHSHVLPRKSDHPSAMSRNSVPFASAAAGG
jgi:hypothetical protein